MVLLFLSPDVSSLLSRVLDVAPIMAQATDFSLPESLPSGSSVKIQSSPNLGIASEALAQEFASTYSGSKASVDVTSSDQALTALKAGDVDIAAIGRPLTDQEKAEGLVGVPIEREKIAIIVGANNPFSGNLTFAQFAQIFRGEITDWSQVGGAPGPIRLIDRPDTSDTRISLSQYEVFRQAPFQTGATATQLNQDDTAAVIQSLGNDGISYAIASHVLDQKGVKIVPMHNTLPDDPRYPYSQPRTFVYHNEATPAIAAFLGLATSSQGQAILAKAQATESASIAAALGNTDTDVTEPAPATPNAATSEPPVAPGTTQPEMTPGTTQPPVAPSPASAATTEAERGAGWLWWLLPLAVLAGLGAWAFLRRSSGDRSAVPEAGAVPPVAPEPEPLPPSPGPDQPSVSAPTLSEPESVPPPPLPPEPVPEPPLVVSPPPEPVIPPEPVMSPPEPPPPPMPVPSPSPNLTPIAAGAAGLAAGAAAAMASTEDQSVIEASKYNVVGRPADGDLDLSGIDDGLPPLPGGYGDSRIVLMPRDPQWAYTYWDVPNSHKEQLRYQGGEQLALRLYDVTDIDLANQTPHNMQQVNCDELARDWYLPIPISDRDYLAEIGYLTADGRWLMLARSNQIRIPPVYPSDWHEDHLLTVNWDDDLRGKTLLSLTPPGLSSEGDYSIYEHIFALAESTEAQRIAGSLFGSMHHLPGSITPESALSSYVFPSGIGAWSLPTVSGLTMSGVGFSASAPPIRPRKFWLVADAELIVYGATEPDATVTISGQPIQLTPDGTFRFQSSFQDGNIDYPIMAVASDGEQTRSIHMTFDRQTLERRTNTQAEAVEEWPSDGDQA